MRTAGSASFDARDQPLGQRLRRFFGEQPAHHRIVGAEPLAHALQAEGQGDAFKFRIDRHRRGQFLLDARQGSVGELAQPIAIGLGALGRAAHQRAGVGEQFAVERRAEFQEGVRLPERPPGL